MWLLASVLVIWPTRWRPCSRCEPVQPWKLSCILRDSSTHQDVSPSMGQRKARSPRAMLLQPCVTAPSRLLLSILLSLGADGRSRFPAASFRDRLLDVIVIEERPIGDLNKGLGDFFGPEGPDLARPPKIHRSYSTRHPAELTGIPGIHHFQARGVTISTSAGPQDATLDGEVQLQTPLRLQVAPEPLRVLVPAMTGGLSTR